MSWYFPMDPLRDMQMEEPAEWRDGNEVYKWEMEEENERFD